MKLIQVCKDCGKEMPVDEKKSNENWTVYKKKCVCGGEGKMVVSEDKQVI